MPHPATLPTVIQQTIEPHRRSHGGEVLGLEGHSIRVLLPLLGDLVFTASLGNPLLCSDQLAV
jgi:hypothetical protein